MHNIFSEFSKVLLYLSQFCFRNLDETYNKKLPLVQNVDENTKTRNIIKYLYKLKFKNKI